MTSTVCFPVGNLCPEGSVIKATAISPQVIDSDGVYRKTGPARVFTTERAAIAAVKGQTDRPIKPGDVIVLIGRGPIGSGMEETYQITSGAQVSAVGARSRVGHRREILGRQYGRVHWTRGTGSVGWRSDWQSL